MSRATQRQRTGQMSTLLLSLLLLLLCGASPGHAANPVAPANCSAAAGTCVRIGYWSCPWSDARCSTTLGHDRMIQWFQDHVASNGGTWHGVPVFWLEAVLSGFFVATPEEVTATINSSFIGEAAWAGGAPLVDYTILPFGSLWSQGMALLERWRIPSIASKSPDSGLYQCAANETLWRSQDGCSAPNTRRFQYAHGTTSPGETYFTPWIGLLKLRKAKSVAIVHTSSIPFYATVRAGILAAAGDNGIDIVYDRVAEYGPDTPAVVDPQSVASIVADLQARQPELDGLAILAQDCVPFIRALAQADYAPKSVAAILCADGARPLETLGPLLDYIVGSSQWDPGLSGTDYSENADLQPWSLFPHIRDGATVGLTSPLRFQQVFRTLMNSSTVVPGYTEAGTLVVFTMLEGAVSLAGSVHPELVQAQLKSFYQPSFYGLLTTNRFGVNNQKAMLTIQRDLQGISHLIAPTSVATADFVYPMPLWSERVYSRAILSSTIEIVLVVLVAVCAAFTSSLMAYLFVHRSRQVFQAAGLEWYLLQGAGCLLAYVAVLTWMVENTSAMCGARVWMWSVAFHLFIDPLIASTFRISLILRRKMLESSKITNEQLLALCLVLLLPQVLINILWVTMAPLTPEIQTMDPSRAGATSWTSCVSQQASRGEGFAFVTLAYSCLLLLVACALAFRVRSASKLFNDARPIAVSVYLFTTLAAVVLVVQVALSHDSLQNERVLFGLRSVGLLIAFQGSIALLYLRRILRKRNSPALHGIRRVPALGVGRDDVLYSQHATRAAAAQRHQGMSALSSLASVGPFHLRGGGVGPAGAGSYDVSKVSVTPLPSYADLLAMEQEALVALIEEYHAVLAAIQNGKLVSQQQQQQQHQQQPQLMQQPLDEATSSAPRDDDGVTSESVSPTSQNTPSPDQAAQAAAAKAATFTAPHPSASPTDESPLLRPSPSSPLPQTPAHAASTASSSSASSGAASSSSMPPPASRGGSGGGGSMHASSSSSSSAAASSSAGRAYSATPEVVVIHMDS